jgi:small-conductance mechanosensitive channel
MIRFAKTLQYRRFFLAPLFGALALALLAAAPGGTSALAQTPVQKVQKATQQKAVAKEALKPDELSRAELDALIATLKDDKARAKLIAQLQTLAKAGAAGKAEEKGPGFGSRLLGDLSERIEGVSRDLVAGARMAVDVPRLWRWASDQLSHPERRAAWLSALWKIGMVIGAGLAALMVLHGLLGGMRGALERRGGGGLWMAGFAIVGRAALDLLPVVAFFGVAIGLLTGLAIEDAPRAATLLLIQSVVAGRLLMIAARVVLAPRSATPRLLPLGDEDANYAFVWVRRLSTVGVYGVFGAQAAGALGLPPAGVAALLHLVGLIFLMLAVIVVLQNRKSVAGWLRGSQDNALHMLRARFADVWHVLAILYLIAMYVVWVMAVEDGFRFIMTATLLSVLVLIATRLAIIGLRRGAARLFTLREDVSTRFPGLQTRTNRYLPVLERAGVLLIDLVALFALLEAWGVDSFAWLATPWGQRLTSSLLAIAGLVIGAVIIWESAGAAIERYLARQAEKHGNGRSTTRARTLLPMLRMALLVLLITIVGLVALSELGVNIAPLLAGAGVVGLAIGFGAQTLVKDIITGVFILLEDQIAVGDVVKVGTHAGLVEALSLRTIRLRDLAGNVHMVPFSEVSTVENMTKDYSRYVFNVGIAYREDTDKVVELLKQLGAELQADPEYNDLIVEPLEVLGVDSFADSAVVIKARITTQPIQQWKVGREFNRRMKKLFDEQGIEIPFPHRTLYFGALKDGSAPPAFVELEGRPNPPAGPTPAPYVPPPAVDAPPASTTRTPDPDGGD